MEREIKLKVVRISDKVIFDVRKYIYSDSENEHHIWCDKWYGHHIIGKDCEWYIKPDDTTNPTEIKERLISEGWESPQDYWVTKVFLDNENEPICAFNYWVLENRLELFPTNGGCIEMFDITYQRIKAIIYGLTNTK